MKVFFVVIDALPNSLVSNEWTPNLWNLASEGSWNKEGGQAVLSTATYPNHASFVSGDLPQSHKIFTNRVWTGHEFKISSDVGPEGDTLFKALARNSFESSVVVGDHHLIGVIGADRASNHWPLDGKRAEVELDEFRYASDLAVLDAIDNSQLISADFGFVHFNEPDTASHIHGPNSEELKSRVKRTDKVLGQFLERIKPFWKDSIVIVVSDHDQEEVVEYGFDLQDALSSRGLPGIVENEGTAAMILDGPSKADMHSIPEISGCAELDPRRLLVWGDTGFVFGPWLEELNGSHGSPRCNTQVAIVGGGHVEAKRIGSLIEKKRPHAWEWARHINDSFGLNLQVN